MKAIRIILYVLGFMSGGVFFGTAFMCATHINNLHAKVSLHEFIWFSSVTFVVLVFFSFIESKYIKKEKFLEIF